MIITNYFSAGGTFGNFDLTLLRNFKSILSGAVTAAVYKEVLSVTGAGVISLAMGYSIDATDRTIGLKIVIDGVTVFDAVTTSFAAVGRNIQAIGLIGETSLSPVLEPMVFTSSLSISLKSSLSETDKIALATIYRKT